MKKADLRKVQEEWYKKLKDEGFEDIEDTSKPYTPLKAWHSFRFVSGIKRDSAESYYAAAATVLRFYIFKN